MTNVDVPVEGELKSLPRTTASRLQGPVYVLVDMAKGLILCPDVLVVTLEVFLNVSLDAALAAVPTPAAEGKSELAVALLRWRCCGEALTVRVRPRVRTLGPKAHTVVLNFHDIFLRHAHEMLTRVSFMTLLSCT